MRGSALPGAATAMFWRWSFGRGLVFALSLSVASTVVLETFNGRIAGGWLIVEDLVMVLVLVLLPPLANVLGGSARAAGPGIGATLAITAALFGVSFASARSSPA